MEEEFELKPLTRGALPAAVKRAEHYRLLNQPEQAESICLDVLEVDPNNQQALVVAVLAISDQFEGGGTPRLAQARQYLERVTDDYARSYYAGILAERSARAKLKWGTTRQFAYDNLRSAMEWFEKAAAIRPAGNDDAILRWNACVRTIRKQNLRPPPSPTAELGLE
jgi:tetratricopeptide (TPR) repeat protein